MHALVVRTLERIGALIQLDRNSAVIHFIGNSEGGIVIIGSTHKPQTIRNGDFATSESLWIPCPSGRHQIKHPFVMTGHFQNRKNLGEVIFHARQVHLVKHNKAWVFTQACFVERSQKLSFIEAFRKLVEVTEHFGAVAIRRLHWNNGGWIVYITTKRIG